MCCKNNFDTTKIRMGSKTFNRKFLLLFTLVNLFYIPPFLLAEEAIKAGSSQTENSGKQLELPAIQGIFPIEQDVLENLNDEQWAWYEKFNKGILFFDGWQSISLIILEHCPLEKRQEIRRFVQRLGVLIGTEWSRQNDIRRINNGMLSEWGDRIKAATKTENKEMIVKVLHEINNEVEGVLSY